MIKLDFLDNNDFERGSLSENHVHIWWVSLFIGDDQEQVLIKCLDRKQREKLSRIQNPAKRKYYIAGRAFLNRLLAFYIEDFESKNEKLELEIGKFGKPMLKNQDDLQFNFSDTCGYGIFAFSRSNELGIDLESLSRQGLFDRIVKRRFADDEQFLIGKDIKEFLKCWTRKEAYGKAIGTGLNYPLRNFTMCRDLSEDEFQIDSTDYFGQQFLITEGRDSFVACLVSQGDKAKDIKAFHFKHDLNTAY